MKHKCIRTCYYLHRLWNPGEVLQNTPGFEDAPPNKHFVGIDEYGRALEEVPTERKTAGDDPRSTLQLIEDLEKAGGIFEEGDSRKQVFAKLLKIEVAEQAGKKKPDKDIPENLSPKAVSELTPDELEKTLKSDLVAMIMRDRGLSVNPIMSKAALFEKDALLAKG